jgi:hypothetical protein
MNPEETMTSSTFTAQRISRTATITLKAPLEKVYPLFDPIGEKEWAAGWNPHILYPGGDLVEEHMVFKTPSHGHGEPEYIWTVSKYMPEQALIEYMVHTPERVWWITIQCRADSAGERTRAEITYTYTGLSELGNAINERALRAMYAHDLKDWEKAINTYIETGTRFEHH